MRANITSLIGIASVIGLSAWVVLEHQKQVGLRRERQALEQRLEQMAQLVSSNEQLSNLLAQANSRRSLTDDQSRELLRLRGQIGVLRQQTSDVETVREQNRQAHATLESTLKNSAALKPAATADYWPQDSWAFMGFASADAALQSSLWAANNGDLKTFLASTTGELQKMIAADLKDKSETEASIKAMEEVNGIKSIRVLNREAQDNDTVIITAELEGPTDSQTQKLMLKKVGSEWKVAGKPQ
jgi:type II secretory pathway component PulJ